MFRQVGNTVDAFMALLKYMAILLLIFIPLGLWKLLELLIWAWKHITISWA